MSPKRVAEPSYKELGRPQGSRRGRARARLPHPRHWFTPVPLNSTRILPAREASQSLLDPRIRCSLIHRLFLVPETESGIGYSGDRAGVMTARSFWVVRAAVALQVMGNHGSSLCKKASWSEFCSEFLRDHLKRPQGWGISESQPVLVGCLPLEGDPACVRLQSCGSQSLP